MMHSLIRFGWFYLAIVPTAVFAAEPLLVGHRGAAHDAP
jgi:hypothetical protein